MKVVLATTFEPFVKGGADLIADWLEAKLQIHGHEVESFRFPFSPHYDTMLDQMLALRLLDLSERGDRLICIRTPSYLLRHPHKVLWFIHHHRPAYDLRNTPYGDSSEDAQSTRYGEAIRNADNIAFREAKKVFANSRVVASRMKLFNDIDAEILYPPLLEPELYRCGPAGDYVVWVSRMVPHKRQHLAIEALRHTRTQVRLVLAGPAESDYLKDLHALIKKHGLESRVTIHPGWIPTEQKRALIAGCLAGVYVPFNEDSYGYATLELQQASKAVIVSSDSGGPIELIKDGTNGIICEPEARAIAAALDRLYSNPEIAARMGQAGPAEIIRLGANWDTVLERLLA
jgi:glycosyltransferase involved in cell wall biosynthesis